MLPPRIEAILQGIEANRRTTLEMVSGLTDADFAFREEGEWSISEIIEHLVAAETGTSKVIRKVLKENAGRLPPYPPDDSGFALRELRVRPRDMTHAPEAARPKGGLQKDELLKAAALARAQTVISVEMMAAADPRSGTFPHPAFGDMNLYEWAFIILLMHERQHHAQIARIIGILRNRGT